jgi:hypothetical protein
VPEVVARVFLVNLALAGLAFITVVTQNMTVSLAMLSVGSLIVAWLLAALAGR